MLIVVMLVLFVSCTNLLSEVMCLVCHKLQNVRHRDYNPVVVMVLIFFCIKLYILVIESKRPGCFIPCNQIPSVSLFQSVVCSLSLKSFSCFSDCLKWNCSFMSWNTYNCEYILYMGSLHGIHVCQTVFNWPRPHFRD